MRETGKNAGFFANKTEDFCKGGQISDTSLEKKPVTLYIVLCTVLQ